VIRGYVVAQEGVFKDRRGEFDVMALNAIVKLANASPNGLKSRLAHPDLSNDGIGKLLGRVKNCRLDTITVRESQGSLKTDAIAVVRGDLHIDPSSHKAPSGDIGEYVLTLAESDPDAMSSSLVLTADQEYRVDGRGLRLKDDQGEELPPLWNPKTLHASDVVDTGDAVDGILSEQLDAEGLPDGVVRMASKLMAEQFDGKPRDFVKEHCSAWLDRYLDRVYGPAEIESVGNAEVSPVAEEADLAASESPKRDYATEIRLKRFVGK